MQKTVKRLLTFAFGVSAIGLADVSKLWADSKSVESNVARVNTSSNRAAPTKPLFVEVRSGEQSWQGLDLGRRANQILLLSRDGQLRRIDLGSGPQVKDLAKPFNPAGHTELDSSLRKEFGIKFKIVRTPHYLICHNTSESFAEEAADLVEEVYRAFTVYFGARGTGLQRPQFPMVILIFDDETQFKSYMVSSSDVLALKQIAGYYSLETNRVAFFNASGKEVKKYGDPRWHNLSTIIHEATHQIAFNSGCHRRFADNPVWFAEGLAMYFEAPEVQGKKFVWGEVGKLNTPRLERFASFRKNGRTADSLKSLIMNDDRFRSDSAAGDAYAESWALTYFLANQRAPQFHKYLKMLAAKPTLQPDTEGQRLEEFQSFFGRDLRLLDTSFLRYIDELPKQNR